MNPQIPSPQEIKEAVEKDFQTFFTQIRQHKNVSVENISTDAVSALFEKYLTKPARPYDCEACHGLGLILAETDEDTLEIQRCDSCSSLRSDNEAAKEAYGCVEAHYAPEKPEAEPIKIPYGEVFELQETIFDVECWNSTDKEGRADLEKGLRIQLQCVNDSTRTTVLASTSQSNDDSRIHQGGILLRNGQKGYRFIIPNDVLSKAIQIPFPEKTPDLIGDIIDYEGGNMDEDRARKFLEGIHESKLDKKLQGNYGRATRHVEKSKKYGIPYGEDAQDQRE